MLTASDGVAPGPAGRTGDAAAREPFGARLERAVTARESQVVLGLDPDPARLWPQAAAAAPAAGDPAARAAGAVLAHCAAAIDAAGPACVAIKPQLACFERLGAAGWDALARTCSHARDRGLLVLADAKRGDIDVSARAYGQALAATTPTPWGEVDGLGADAVTASPYLGADAVGALLDVARAAGAGLFVLVRTSNPGAADLQDLELRGGGALWHRTAELVRALGEAGEDRGTAAGAALCDVGAVVGATAPEHLATARRLMPRAPFLLPGIGAQGGRVEDLAPAFAPGRAGGLVTASRSIVRAHETAGGEPPAAARAEAERLRAAAWALGG